MKVLLASMLMEKKIRRMIMHGAVSFERMRKAGKLAAENLEYITPDVKVGTLLKTWIDYVINLSFRKSRALTTRINNSQTE